MLYLEIEKTIGTKCILTRENGEKLLPNFTINGELIQLKKFN